jgi:hypothetical protein
MQKKNQKETKNIHKKQQNIESWSIVPQQRHQKKGLVDNIYAYQISVGLQADKSSVVVKGPFFP